MDKNVRNWIMKGKERQENSLSTRDKNRYSEIETEKIVDYLGRKGVFGLEISFLDTRTDRVEFSDKEGFESSKHLTNLGYRLENGVYVLNREESVSGGVLLR
jgi:hypothetical protein